MKEAFAWQKLSCVGALLLCSVLTATAAFAGAVLDVTPDFFGVTGFSGSAGGPFGPSTINYTVTNTGTGEPLSWCVTKSQPWVTVSPACGDLDPGESAAVRVSVDAAVARTLAIDGYSDRLLFTNMTNGRAITPDGSAGKAVARRYVTLNVLEKGSSTFQGFGAGTRGGSGGTVFHVTTLADNGDDNKPVPGSLRDAVSQPNRYIVFDVGGTIVLKTNLYVQGDHITIDGGTAPPPGITLTRQGIVLRGNRGVHDVVLKDLRVRDLLRNPGSEQFDGIQIAYGAFNILVDHVSTSGADDGNIDITYDAHDVTVRWSILASPKSGKNMLVKYHSSRITLHHNLMMDSDSRFPQIDNDDEWTLATDTTVDLRNNLMWDWGTIATRVSKGVRVNVVNNYYSKSPFALVVNSLARAYTKGNVVHESAANLNLLGTETVPFPAPAVDITDAVTAASEVRGGAGARPRDDFDESLVARIDLPSTIPEPAQVAIAVVKAGNGEGTILSVPDIIDCGTTCSGLVDEGTLVTFTATPAIGSDFAGFSGPGECTSGQVSATVAVTCVATFVRQPDPEPDPEPDPAPNPKRKADMVIATLSGPIGAEPGGTINVKHTTQNLVESGPSEETTTRLYLSKNQKRDASDSLLASVPVAALAPGQRSVATTGVVVPANTPAGTYYVVAQADDPATEAETSEINNSRSVRVIVGADLTISGLVAPNKAKPGGSFVMTVTTTNANMVGPAAPSVTRIYLSRDRNPGVTEIVAEHTAVRLAPGARDTWTTTIPIPASLAPGRYYLIAHANDDGDVAETKDNNNGRTRAIQIRK